MWSAGGDATPHLWASAHGRRAPGPDGGPALVRRLCPAPLPNAACQCPRRAGAAHRRAAGVRRPDGARRLARLPCPRTRGLTARLLAPPPAAAAGGSRRTGRAVAGAAAPPPTRVRPSPQPVDAGPGGRGERCPGADPHRGQRRSPPQDLAAAGEWLEARQAVEHPSRSAGRATTATTRQRDRLLQWAARPPDWALGFAAEGGWSRRAQPPLPAWAEADDPLRLVEQPVAPPDPAPKALACYGLVLRRAGQEEQAAAVWRRVGAGRPVSALTPPSCWTGAVPNWRHGACRSGC